MRTILLTAILVTLAGAASGQPITGYVFGAPGGVTGPGKTRATLQAGAGLEVALPKGFGAGVDAGVLSPFASWGNETLGFFSANGFYHFRREDKVDPFVTAGYTAFFRSGHLNLFNFGGGVNLWATRHIGGRIELRDQINSTYETLHYWNFRLGLTFR